MNEAILTPEQRRELAIARIRWTLSLAERRSREATAIVEACAIIGCNAGIPAAQALGLVVELLPSHRATAAQIGQIFADVYRQRRPRE